MPTDSEFQSAFETEMTGEATPPVPETPPKETPSETPPEAPTPSEEPTPEDGEKPAEPKEQVPPAGDGEKPAEGEPANPSEQKPKEEPEAPKTVTKDDIVEAMRDYNKETASRVDLVQKNADEIISKMHPEGIDTKIYDTNGEVIRTAQDIVDRGLLNPDTREPFTYEQAASWIMAAQKTQNENVEKLKNYAQDLAETNVSLFEENQRVMAEWGDILKAMPEKAKEIAETYVATQLEFDPTDSYITKMNMSPETYYKLVMSPYRQLNEALAAKTALEAEQAEKQEKLEQANEQEERSGLPQRGTSSTKPNTGDPMLDALVEELAKP